MSEGLAKVRIHLLAIIVKTHRRGVLLAIIFLSSFVIHHSSFAADTVPLLRQKLERTQKKLAEEQIKRLVYETQLQVVALHSFTVVAPVDYAELTTAVLSRIVDDSIGKQYPGQRLHLYVWFNQLMGAFPENIDFAKYLKDLMGEQAAGIYDPSTKKLYVSRTFDVNGSLGHMILAHEIAHAMQDQDFNLRGMGVEDNDNDDRAMAALAVAEGDATLLMSEYLVRYGSIGSLITQIPSMLFIDQSKFQNAPPAIQEMLLFPYIEGMNFFQTLAGRTRQNPKAPADWAVGMDPAWRGRVFQDPPETTEQIMHPNKYLACELPERIDQLDELTTNSSQDVFGEFGVMMLLEQSLVKPVARRAAAGWNGDRILLSASDKDRSFKWVTRWDTEKDAGEFADAMAQALQKRVLNLHLTRKSNDWSGETANAKVSIRMSGKGVDVQGAFGK